MGRCGYDDGICPKKRIPEADREVDLPELLVLAIPDEYTYMEEELVEMLRL
ncbi:MAG: hypothetical protein AAF824_06510 [Bacteroidota bacterium]